MRAGWNPDPENPDRMRWWDGQRWTSATKAASGTQPPPRLTPVPGATASKTPGEKAKDRRRLLFGAGAAAVLLVVFLGFRSIVSDLDGPETNTDSASNTRPTGAAIAQPYPKAAPPPPKSAEEIAASAAAQASADENARRRAEAEAAAVFDRATYPAISARDLALLSKNPDANRGKKMVVYGQVAQFDAMTGAGLFRADVGASPGSGYDLNVLVTGDAVTLAPVVQGNYVTIYGVLTGSQTYENPFGGSATAATMTASIIDITN
ncbi:hypothetical protein CH282_15900 [Rhodococcus sp. 06-418-1B]|nr:DUF2510 domain-containing protein [Rhodococcus sp. 06-418-1B]OZC83435.1 hypothetical protein CH282_15900 [Rhodococcus sp. 06-418-1B]